MAIVLHTPPQKKTKQNKVNSLAVDTPPSACLTSLRSSALFVNNPNKWVLWCFCAASFSAVLFVRNCCVFVVFLCFCLCISPPFMTEWRKTDPCCGLIKGGAVKLNVMLLILFLWRGRCVFGCNYSEEFIRVFKRCNKHDKKEDFSLLCGDDCSQNWIGVFCFTSAYFS